MYSQFRETAFLGHMTELRYPYLCMHACGGDPHQGAFYMYVDLSAHGVVDSLGMCGALLEEARSSSAVVCLPLLRTNAPKDGAHWIGCPGGGGGNSDHGRLTL